MVKAAPTTVPAELQAAGAAAPPATNPSTQPVRDVAATDQNVQPGGN